MTCAGIKLGDLRNNDGVIFRISYLLFMHYSFYLCLCSLLIELDHALLENHSFADRQINKNIFHIVFIQEQDRSYVLSMKEMRKFTRLVD